MMFILKCEYIWLIVFLPQLPRGHRVIILTLLERVTKEHIQNIPESLANELVTLGSAELTASQVSVAEIVLCGGCG